MSLLPWEQTTLGGPSRILQLTDSPEDGCVCVCVCVHVCVLSHVQPFATPWTAACQSSLSMGFPILGNPFSRGSSRPKD